jgi:uncharacterized protein (TIGR02001 family)
MAYGRVPLLSVLTAAMAVGFASVAQAADVGEDEYEIVDEHMFDVAFGAAFTTDYISRGITQTDHHAAVQGYIEPSIGIFYAGIWASNVAFGGVGDVEVDYYAGIRPEFDNLSFDFGYLQWTYLNDPASNGGEFYALAYATVHDPLTLGAEFYFNPGDSSTYVEANADFAFTDSLGASGALGYVNGDIPYTTWNAGLYYAIHNWATLDLRYTDTNLSTADCAATTGLTGNECDARLMLSLSIDLAVSDLAGGDE